MVITNSKYLEKFLTGFALAKHTNIYGFYSACWFIRLQDQASNNYFHARVWFPENTEHRIANLA